jgi:hypothetical protein
VDDPTHGASSPKTRLLTKISSVAIPGAIAVYTLLRISYGAFYGAFGVAPEDVGLTYPSVVFQSVVGLAVLGIILVVIVAIWRLTDQAVTVALNKRAARRRKKGKKGPVRESIPLRRFGIGASLIFGLFLLVDEIPRQAFEFAERAKNGQAVTWAGFRVDSIVSEKFPLLPYRAEPASIQVLGPGDSAEADLSSRTTLMYLGTGGDAHVLFDRVSEEVLRVPVRSAILVNRDVARADPYDFPTITFFGLVVIFVLTLAATEVLDEEERRARVAGILGVAGRGRRQGS